MIRSPGLSSCALCGALACGDASGGASEGSTGSASSTNGDASTDVGTDGGPTEGGPTSATVADDTSSSTDDASDGSSDGGEVMGDRYVAQDGVDAGDCSVDPCLTFAYAGTQLQSGEVLVVGDGTYADGIDGDTFPRGSDGASTTIRAAHPGAVTVTGPFALYDDGDFFLAFDGLRFENDGEKQVAGGHVAFTRAAFVGGPASGNAVNFVVGTNDFDPGAWNVSCEDCVFYGQGGRYAALVYRGQDVTLRRAVGRKDGGWGLTEATTMSEPEGVITFYESRDSICDRCVALDSLKLSDDSAEALGALVQNSHTDGHDNVAFIGCFSVANEFAGFAFEGQGSVGNASVTDSLSAQNQANGLTANVDGNITFTRIASRDNAGTGVASYGDAAVALVDSRVSGNAGGELDGVDGSTDGPGPDGVDLRGFDSAWLRAELCEHAGVTRGLCARDIGFQAYLQSF